jgi:hypothetical protein
MNFIRSLSLIVVMTIFTSKTFAIESLEGFLVEAYDHSFRVISPKKFKDQMEVIIVNKTLIKLIGVLSLNGKKTEIYFSVPQGKYEKKIIPLKKNDMLEFIPLSPSFQEVELIVGKDNYEIPAKK